jgi:hypothetical protein
MKLGTTGWYDVRLRLSLVAPRRGLGMGVALAKSKRYDERGGTRTHAELPTSR